MKIMFISDIHGISTNLEYIKTKYNELGCNKLVCLGDLYYIGPRNTMIEGYDVNKVGDFLMSFKENLICMRGNCDSDVDVKVSDFPINDTLSCINVDGIDIYLTHGNIYNENDNRKFTYTKGVLVLGHFHYSYIKKNNDMFYLNTGSISLPRNNSKPSYTIYENKTFTIYDIEGNIVDSLSVN